MPDYTYEEIARMKREAYELGYKAGYDAGYSDADSGRAKAIA